MASTSAAVLEKVELLLDPVIQNKDTLLTPSTSFTSTSVPSPSDQSVFESTSLPTFSEMLPQEKNNSFQETVLPFNKNKENIITTETSQGPVTSYATLLSPNGKQHTTLSPLDYENESAKVIEEVKNTISGIIKEVVASNQNSSKNSSFEDIVKLIKDSIPSDIAIKSLKVNEKELQSKIRETVGEILTDREIQSVVRLRNNTKQNSEHVITGEVPLSDAPKILDLKTTLLSTELLPSTDRTDMSNTSKVSTGEMLSLDLDASIEESEDKGNLFNLTSNKDTSRDESVLVDIPNFNTVAYSATPASELPSPTVESKFLN